MPQSEIDFDPKVIATHLADHLRWSEKSHDEYLRLFEKMQEAIDNQAERHDAAMAAIRESLTTNRISDSFKWGRVVGAIGLAMFTLSLLAGIVARLLPT